MPHRSSGAEAQKHCTACLLAKRLAQLPGVEFQGRLVTGAQKTWGGMSWVPGHVLGEQVRGVR